jgi:hypothetical protein
MDMHKNARLVSGPRICSMPLWESSEYQMGAVVTGRPVGRPITSIIGRPREVWPWAMKLLFGSPVFLSYWPLPLK